MFNHLDAEFAMILYDSRKKWLIAARDPIGIRPLFYGYSESGHIAFAVKTLPKGALVEIECIAAAE